MANTVVDDEVVDVTEDVSTPGPIFTMRLLDIKPSPENDTLYRPIDRDDSDLIALSEDIGRRGLLEPIVLTEDDFIVSGHRRHAAARLAGLEMVPARRCGILRGDPGFLPTLAAFNRQRGKTGEERAREELVAASDPEAAHEELVAYRKRRAQPADLGTLGVDLGAKRGRRGISKAKRPMLEAVLKVINERVNFWPLSDRSIHYGLLNFTLLRHASKPESRYVNDRKSYKDLCDLLTRARLTGEIPMDAIDDETRAFCMVYSHPDPGAFVRDELDNFLFGYRRQLQRDQPVHIEVLAEKLTVQSIVQPVCANYCLPLTIGRGFSSLPPRAKMADRFKKSGKDWMTLIVVSDADPEGESIAESFARSMRDDFRIRSIQCVKAALTPPQARAMGLPTAMVAKEKSSRRAGFVQRHGEQVWELEALTPVQLQAALREAIEGVMDQEAFARSVEQEKLDAAYLDAFRKRARASLLGLALPGK